MKKREKIDIPGSRMAVWVCIPALLLIGVGLAVLYWFTGWYPLLLTAIAQLLPAFIQMVLLLPVIRQPEQPLQQEDEKRISVLWKRFLYRLKNTYWASRRTVLVALIVIGGLAAQLLFWKSSAKPQQALNYLIPVILGVLFVATIAMEKWCKFVGDGAEDYTSAQLNGLCSMLRLLRVVFLLDIAAIMLQLLGIYNADPVLKVLLSLLFAYETACLAFSLAVRAIRKELDTQPEVLANLVGMGSDMNILRYLEENTGITMRSLWSLQLVKELLPGALAVVVLVVWLSTGMVQIESHQEGVLLRWGKLQPETLKPGFHLTLPWPLDCVHVLDKGSVRSVTIGYERVGELDNIWTESHGGDEYLLLLGNGEEVVAVNLVLEYRLSDTMQYVKNSSSPESILSAQAYRIVTRRTISTDLNTLLATDREAFAESFRQELMEELKPYQLGIEVVNVVLESIHPPMKIAAIYQSVISAEIQAEGVVLEAQNKANQKVINAKKQVVETVGAALASQHENVAAAQSAVTEFMAAVSADDTYTQGYRFQKYIDAVTRAYADAKLIIVGDGVDSGNLYIGSIEKDTPNTTEPAEAEQAEE